MDGLLTELSAAILPALVALFGTLTTIIINRASKVAQERWGIEIDDSAGRPLGQTPIGTLLRLTADCALRDAAPTGKATAPLPVMIIAAPPRARVA